MAKKPKTDEGFSERLKGMLHDWLPWLVQTQATVTSEPPSLLAGLTADRIHMAISSAEQGDTTDLFTIYRDVLLADTHLQSEVDKRFIAILGEEPVIQAKSDSPDDVHAADVIRAAVDRVPDFMGLCADLLWGTIWPLAIVERTYKRADPSTGLSLDWNEFIAVPDHLLTWRNSGQLQIALCDPTTGMPNGEFAPAEPSRYIIHRGHLMRTADNWGGPMRSLVWWFFLKTMDREWWVRFLDKFGTPFITGKFDKNDDRSRQVLERAFRMSSKIGGLVVTKDTQVELVQAQSQGNAKAFQEFHDACNREISKRVVGQTLSSEAQPTGLGSGTSDLQGQVRGDIGQFDRKKLSQTIRMQLFKPLLRLNGIRGAVPDLIWGQEQTEETTATATALSSLKTAGLRLADSAIPVLSKRMGLDLERDAAPEPKEVPTALPPKLGKKKALSSGPPGTRDAVAASDSISRESAASLSLVLRGSLAPARQVILESSTPEEAETRLLALFTDWSPTKAAEVVETALTAGAWNGVQDG